MEDTKKHEAGKDLSNEQAAEVGGGASCGATATLSASPSVTNAAPSPAEAMIGIYDGVVETTTHVIETVAHSLK